MGRTIYYRAMHIKTSQGIIPFGEIGSSNCYNADGSRDRNWENFTISNRKFFDDWNDLSSALEKREKEYLEQLERYRNSDKAWYHQFADASFGSCNNLYVYRHNCDTTTFRVFRNFFKRGMDYAIDVNDAIENGLLYAYWYDKQAWMEEPIKSETHLFASILKGRWIGANKDVASRLYLRQKAK